MRQFEQRAILSRNTSQLQLLVRKRMCEQLNVFERLLSQLSRLAARRRLFGDEPYQAVLLLGELTMHVYEESADEDEDKDEKRSALSRGSAQRSALNTDDAQGGYLLLIGKGMLTVGSNRVAITKLEDETPHIKHGDKLQLLGRMYTVEELEGPLMARTAVVFSEPLVLADGFVTTDEIQRTGAGETWLFLQQRVADGGADPDMQLLLFNMKAHEIAVQLLGLPVGKRPASSELDVREVIIGAYRLIKALSSGFKLMQMAMLPFQDKMIEQVQYNLTSADITPTSCLISIMKDNPTAALQVREDVLRKFVRMASENRAPRFLRFLFNVTGPAGQPVLRAQALVIQLVRENAAACVLFNDAEGRKQRQELVQASDHVKNPRGLLAYHIELIRLIGRCAEGIAPGPEALARQMVPLESLLSHLTEEGLPIILKAQYLQVLDEAYFYAKLPRGVDIGKSPEMVRFFEMFAALVNELASDIIPSLDADFAEVSTDRANDLHATVEFVMVNVMHTCQLYFTHQYTKTLAALDGQSDPLTESTAKFAASLIGLKEAISECLVEHLLPEQQKFKDLLNMLAKEGILPAERMSVEVLPANSTLGGAHRSITTPRITHTKTIHPQRQLKDFISAFRETETFGSEFSSFIEVFLEGLISNEGAPGKRKGALPSKKKKRTPSRRKVASVVPLDDDPMRKKAPAANLVRQLKWGCGESLNVDQTITCARVLCGIIEDASKRAGTTNLLRQRQESLNQMGASAVALAMVASENHKLYLAGLNLGVDLLAGGSWEVQSTMYGLLESGEVKALDGSGTTVFTRIRSALRLSEREIHRRKAFLATQKMQRDSFEEMTLGLSEATIEVFRRDLDAEFETLAHPCSLLCFLQRLCEGHYVEMQDLLHDQPNSKVSSSLVSDAALLLIELEANLDEYVAEQAQLCCDLLVEVVQGNTTGVIATVLSEFKLSETLNGLLCNTSISPAAQLNVQHSALVLLISLLEGDEEVVGSWLARYATALDIPHLTKLAKQYSVSEPSSGTEEANMSDKRIAIGFHIAILLRKVSEDGTDTAALDDEYSRVISSVEICLDDESIQRVYFRTPACVPLLTRKAKDELLWGVDRNTPGVALQEFLQAVPGLHIEMQWQERLSRIRALAWFTRRETMFNQVAMALSVVQNALLIVDSSLYNPKVMSGMQKGDFGYEFSHGSTPIYRDVSLSLGVLQMVLCLFKVMIHFMRTSVQLQLKLWCTKSDVSVDQAISALMSPVNAAKFVSHFVWVAAFHDWELQVHLAFLLFAMLPVIVREIAEFQYFFYFHLYLLVVFNGDLQNVTRAVTTNGRQLLLTVMLGVIMIYGFAIWGFVALGDQFVEGYCQTPAICFLSIMSTLASGDVGGFMSIFAHGDIHSNTSYSGLDALPVDSYISVFVFQIAFFVVIITILLNIIFGQHKPLLRKRAPSLLPTPCIQRSISLLSSHNDWQ